MKRSQLLLSAALIILAIVVGACTRSASGGASDVPDAESALPNPVSTQSQLMKEIIAGTQTAMAVPLDATEAAPAEDAGEEDVQAEEEADAEATAIPEAEVTAVPLPTSTPGPAPVVELKYNTKKCIVGAYICIVSYEKDQTVTVQATYPWLLDNMDLTFKMGLEGVYDYSTYVVTGTAKYEPEGLQGFQTTLTIPDSLRGIDVIVVLLETNNPIYYGSDFFSNN